MELDQKESSSTSLMLDTLPNELIFHVFSFLNADDLFKCCQTSQTFRSIAMENALWINICQKLWRNKQNVSLKRFQQRLSDQIGSNPTANQDYWRSTFFKVWNDRKRQKITITELNELKWKFNMHFETYHSNNNEMTIKWDENYTLFMKGAPMQPIGRTMRWVFLTPTLIQVERYPPLIMKRRSDWGWELKNAFVCFVSWDENVGKNVAQESKDGEGDDILQHLLLPDD